MHIRHLLILTLIPLTSIAAQPQTGGNLFTTISQGGILMIPLLILFLISLTIITERTVFLIRNKAWSRARFRSELEKFASLSQAKYREELEDEVTNEARVVLSRTERGLALLNGIGNVAPIIGFFGTVLGMIDAFAAIAAATSVNAKVVAVGIQIALVTTAGGLAVAVPALVFYHFMSNILQNLYAEADEIAGKLAASLPRMSQKQSN